MDDYENETVYPFDEDFATVHIDDDEDNHILIGAEEVMIPLVGADVLLDNINDILEGSYISVVYVQSDRYDFFRNGLKAKVIDSVRTARLVMGDEAYESILDDIDAKGKAMGRDSVDPWIIDHSVNTFMERTFREEYRERTAKRRWQLPFVSWGELGGLSAILLFLLILMVLMP